jgi:hypothetical protein
MKGRTASSFEGMMRHEEVEGRLATRWWWVVVLVADVVVLGSRVGADP